MSRHFPVIDLEPFCEPQVSAGLRLDIVRQVASACEETGFFAVTGHGVPRTAIADLVALSYDFFDLPLGEKLEVQRPRPEQNRGYIAPGEERLARLRGDETPPDLKELYTIGPFDLPDTPYFTGPAAYPSFAPNLWPTRPAGLRPALQAYWHELDRVARMLCRTFAEALELPSEFFDQYIDKHISQLRIMHYPPPAAAPLPGQMRAGAHSDLGMMTLLYSDNDIGGLEVMNRTGRWVRVPVIDDAFTVNLGDLMMRWTNDRWRSTLHRVVNPPEAANDLSRRLSIGMFFIPNYDAPVVPLSGSGETSRYPPVTVADYRTSRFASTASRPAAQ
ncbi:MAG: isopenicillin N synthase family oxygenase [Alphaproteobacteria bacterium]|nr:isopenicillin N synthase family oxygenase [Alphaproteobacteria bacterium]